MGATFSGRPSAAGPRYVFSAAVTYTHEGVHGDIDIVACCDGHLVLAECKSRDQSDPAAIEWHKIADQIRSLATVGKMCKAGFVVLASMIDSYPRAMVDEVESIGSADSRVHLLNREDLEQGHRWIKEEPFTVARPLSLGDLLPEAFPEVTYPRLDEPREIVTDVVTQSIGTINLPSGEQRESQNAVPPEGQ